MRALTDLRPPELSLIAVLRLWPEGPEMQAALWNGLCSDLGPGRARACLNAFERFDAELRRSAWVLPRIARPDAPDLTADEETLLSVVREAAEGEREAALLQASFLVRPAAMMPLVDSAARLFLPLMCLECQLRLAARGKAPHPRPT